MKRISAIAGKWRFEDLIPGLSDFDTRFIVEDGMSVEEWCDMSHQVGSVHLELCTHYPHWARNLEHLPGINLEWRELLQPATYYPEYPQWTFYNTEDTEQKDFAERTFATREWDERDEYFHLKKFCTFFGRYNRGIDPPINLGSFSDKYALHSRFLHYFCPPLQAGLSILRKRAVPGKLESVRLAEEMFPKLSVFGEMLSAIDRHYEVPELYQENELVLLEDRLEAALVTIKGELEEVITILPNARKQSSDRWRSDLDDFPIDPGLKIFDAAKFSRLMRGRLEFYAASPSHFDAGWLIENELNRIRRNFFEIPFDTFWKLRGRINKQDDSSKIHVQDPLEIVDLLCPEIITAEQVSCIRSFDGWLREPRHPENLPRIARGIAEVFDGFYAALDTITNTAKSFSGETQ